MGTVEAVDPGCFAGRTATQGGHALGVNAILYLLRTDVLGGICLGTGFRHARPCTTSFANSKRTAFGMSSGRMFTPTCCLAGRRARPPAFWTASRSNRRKRGAVKTTGWVTMPASGHKLHAFVDAEGLPIRVVVHSAGIQDRDGAALVLDNIRERHPLAAVCLGR